MLSEQVFQTLRDRIVHGEYPQGMKLSEKELCGEFGISRTPLREALLKLRDMKLVNAAPGFGTYVSPIDMNEIRFAFEVKVKLEEQVGELAAQRIRPDELDELDRLIIGGNEIIGTDLPEKHPRLIQMDLRFHEIMCESARNPILKEFHENLHSRCARLWSSSLTMIVSSKDVLDQLRAVWQAVKSRDSKAAGELMRVHVQYFIDRIRKVVL